MKSKFFILIGLIAGCSTVAEAARYRVAYVRERGSNMVIVVSGAFFNSTDQQKRGWFPQIEACAKSAGLVGQTLIVGSPNGGYYYWGPTDYQPFLRSINMDWVNKRVNKELTCNF